MLVQLSVKSAEKWVTSTLLHSTVGLSVIIKTSLYVGLFTGVFVLACHFVQCSPFPFVCGLFLGVQTILLL
jgi:hypothetical protein